MRGARSKQYRNRTRRARREDPNGEEETDGRDRYLTVGRLVDALVVHRWRGELCNGSSWQLRRLDEEKGGRRRQEA
jgi:hypothetical protein